MFTMMGTDLFAYEFMRNAFIAGTLAAVLAGAVGYFVALRNLAFAGHALTHVGFAGAAGAGLLGLTPMGGQLIVTLLAAMGMGVLGDRVTRDNLSIGIILSFSLGLGSLFLYFYGNYAGQVTAILFGDLLGVSHQALTIMFILTPLSLLVLGIMARPLLFTSLDPELAEAKGVNLSGIGIAFLSMMAIAVTLASQVVGVLLVFTLLIGPAAIATQWTKTFWSGMTVSIILAVLIVWVSIILSYVTDWPVSFWISTLVLVLYMIRRG
jgi:zinc/manganese transport system permease protein